jgi:hypothetical protein
MGLSQERMRWMKFQLLDFRYGQEFFMSFKRNSKDNQPNRSAEGSKNKQAECD